MKQLDLGCGPHPKLSFGATEVFGVDIAEFNIPNIKVADLAIEPIPYDDEMFDIVTAYDFIEHIPNLIYYWDDALKTNVRRNSVIELFNEIYRVLKPGGMFFAFVPEHPLMGSVQDPTHVSFWNQASIEYFAGSLVGFTQQYGLKYAFVNPVVRRDVASPLHLCMQMYKP